MNKGAEIVFPLIGCPYMFYLERERVHDSALFLASGFCFVIICDKMYHESMIRTVSDVVVAAGP